MSRIKWGLVGCGAHGTRYLEPRNSGGRDIRVFRRGERIHDVDVCIIATPPASHTGLALSCLQQGIGVLLEKPAALTLSETELILDCAERRGSPPLLIASPHLFARKFLELGHSADATVTWAGPERADGSCSGYLDWGPHAWSMATALGTERVVTGVSHVRTTVVESNGKRYQGEWLDTESPMLAQIETLERMMHGGFDWRAGKTFVRQVYTRLFANQAASTVKL